MIFCGNLSGCRLGIFLAILSGAAALPGCQAQSGVPKQEPAVDHARSQVEQGPVRVTAEVQPSKPRLSDLPTLTLTIDHEEGVTIEKPLFGSKIDKFAIRDLREPLPKSDKGRVIVQQIYTLEPTEVGRMRIDPIPVAYTDHRPSGDNREHAVETEPLSVEVTSLLGDKIPKLGDLRGPAAPMVLASGVPVWVWAIVAVVIVAIVALVRRKRHGRTASYVTQKVLSLEMLANLELDKLLASGLAANDIKQFFIELTGIVRRYIEGSTGIHAQEQTTEEFLREISRAGKYAQEVRMRLRDFLEAADLVKFAAHRPNSEDVDESIRRARLFIGTGKSSSLDAETQK
jgi:hypothetical protein